MQAKGKGVNNGAASTASDTSVQDISATLLHHQGSVSITAD